MSCGILKKYLTPSVNINTAAAQWLSPCGGGVVVWCAGMKFLIPGSNFIFATFLGFNFFFKTWQEHVRATWPGGSAQPIVGLRSCGLAQCFLPFF